MNVMENYLNIAPILEYDDDESTLAKEYFFSNGKKTFEDFDKVKALEVDKCIIFYSRAFSQCKEIYEKCEKIYEFKSASTISPVYLYDNRILIALGPLGGPASANLMEELMYNGINKFIACGSCGCLSENIKVEKDFFVPTEAIRDEGLSYHYLPASRTVWTDVKVNKQLEASLKRYNQEYVKGITWTIDALYRETPNRTERRKKEGAIAVEMECASLASVAKFNNVKFGALLYFTDRVGKDSWKWRTYDKVSLRTHLLKICIDAIDNLK